MTTVNPATLGTTFTSLLSTVSTSANAITSTVSGIATAGDMFNTYMSNKAKEQRFLSENKLSKNILIAENSLRMEVAKHLEVQRKFAEDHPENAKLLNDADQEIERVLNKIKSL